jgi:hypothetical protein
VRIHDLSAQASLGLCLGRSILILARSHRIYTQLLIRHPNSHSNNPRQDSPARERSLRQTDDGVPCPLFSSHRGGQIGPRPARARIRDRRTRHIARCSLMATLAGLAGLLRRWRLLAPCGRRAPGSKLLRRTILAVVFVLTAIVTSTPPMLATGKATRAASHYRLACWASFGLGQSIEETFQPKAVRAIHKACSAKFATMKVCERAAERLQAEYGGLLISVCWEVQHSGNNEGRPYSRSTEPRDPPNPPPPECFGWGKYRCGSPATSER